MTKDDLDRLRADIKHYDERLRAMNAKANKMTNVSERALYKITIADVRRERDALKIEATTLRRKLKEEK